MVLCDLCGASFFRRPAPERYQNKNPPLAQSPEVGQAQHSFLVDFEVEHIRDLETGTVIQHQVSADEYVHMVRRWRR